MGRKTQQLAIDRNGNDDSMAEKYNSSLLNDNNRGLVEGTKSCNIVGNSSDVAEWLGVRKDYGYKPNKVNGELWANNA